MRLFKSFNGKRFLLFILTICSATWIYAQDKKLDIDVDVNREPVWYQQPWTWVVGLALFILLLVALLRGTRKR